MNPPCRCQCRCWVDLMALGQVIVVLTRKLERADAMILAFHRERQGMTAR